MAKIKVARNGSILFECESYSEFEKKLLEGEITLDDHWWAEGVSKTWLSLRQDMPEADEPPPLPIGGKFPENLVKMNFRVPEKCPKCSHKDCQSFKMIHSAGTTDSLNIGFVGDNIAMSAGRKRTAMANHFKPPSDPRRGSLMTFVAGKVPPKEVQEYQEAMLLWQNSWCCMKCGCTFFCLNDLTAPGCTRYVLLKMDL